MGEDIYRLQEKVDGERGLREASVSQLGADLAGGFTENRHSIDVDSPPPLPSRFSMSTSFHPQGESCFDLDSSACSQRPSQLGQLTHRAGAHDDKFQTIVLTEIAALKAGPGRCCMPQRQTHREPSILELDDDISSYDAARQILPATSSNLC